MRRRPKLPEVVIDPQLKDFRNFLYLVWKHLNLPTPTPVQYDIADWIQSPIKRAVVEAFRGVGKSWITSAFVCHQLLWKPHMNILVVSASKTRADDFSTFTLRLINEIPCLMHLKPDDTQRNSKIAFDVRLAPASHAPSVKSVGITGQITGSRADLVVADDIESQNNSQTQQMRDKLAETVKEFDAVIKPDGRILYLGTPQTEQSIYNLLPERGYTIRIWPARIPSVDYRNRFSHRLAPFIQELCTAEGKPPYVADGRSLPAKTKDPVDPARFSELDLQEREASYGRSGFALQFMLDTTLSDLDKHPLKLADLIVHPLDFAVGPQKVVWASSPELAWSDIPCVGLAGDRFYRPMEILGTHEPYQGAVMAIDPSGRGRDETGYSVVKMLHSQLFLTRSGGLTGGYDRPTLLKLANIAKEQKVNQIIIEANFGDGMFMELFKPVLVEVGYPVTIEELRHSKQKEMRIIDTLEPILNQHRLIVDPKVIIDDHKSTQGLSSDGTLSYQLFYQLSRLTRDRGSLRQDDRLDALAMAVGYWVERLARSIDDSIDESKNEDIRKSLEAFTDNIFNRKIKHEPVWMSRS